MRFGRLFDSFEFFFYQKEIGLLGVDNFFFIIFRFHGVRWLVILFILLWSREAFIAVIN